MNSSILLTIGLFLSSISTTTCLIPDEYKLTITVRTNDTYVVNYKGNVIFAPAVNEKVNGNYNDSKDQEVGKLISELENTTGMKTVEYLGDGTFYIEIKTVNDMSEDYVFISEDLGFFKIISEYDELRIEGLDLSSDVKADLESVGIDMNGRLRVKCNYGINVKKHNAHLKEDKSSTVNYTWKLDLNTSIPDITIEYANGKPKEIENDIADNDNNSRNVEGYRFTYKGYENNSDGSSTWYYSTKAYGSASNDLDYWQLALEDEHTILDASESSNGLNETNAETGIQGIGFTETVPNEAYSDEVEFKFILDKQYEVGTVKFAYIAGDNIESGELFGPSAECTNEIVNDNYSREIEGYRFTYLGHSNNEDGTSTWKYTVEASADPNHDLTHWVLSTDEDKKLLTDYSNAKSITNDNTTGLYGLKFSEKVKSNGDSGIMDFYFTLYRQYEIEPVYLGYKAGSDTEYGLIYGPSSTCLNPEDELEEWVGFGKSYTMGDKVLYNNKIYVCLISHTAYGDRNWNPSRAKSLWDEVD